MSFFSLKFLLFFVLVLLLLHKARSVERQQVILLVASFIFYAAWDWRLLSLLIGVSMVVWQAVKHVADSQKALLAGVGIPLLSLGVCKYLGFFYDSFIALLGVSSIGALQIILPLGISFYTFLAISYILDVYHKKITIEKNWRTVMLYISFFPTVTSGPITYNGPMDSDQCLKN